MWAERMQPSRSSNRHHRDNLGQNWMQAVGKWPQQAIRERTALPRTGRDSENQVQTRLQSRLSTNRGGSIKSSYVTAFFEDDFGAEKSDAGNNIGDYAPPRAERSYRAADRTSRMPRPRQAPAHWCVFPPSTAVIAFPC
jgi:hypothetical protein